ncbi:hypothetical protein GW796_09690 [archaeon]|nr:hypothetical protein [archaeon]
MFEILEPVWNWSILGVILIVLEMLLGTFYLLSFGLACFVVAIITVTTNNSNN